MLTLRIERYQPLPRDDEQNASSMHRGDDRRAVARLLVIIRTAGLPLDRWFARPVQLGQAGPSLLADVLPYRPAGARVECDDSGVRLPTNLDDDQTAFEKRRTTNAEECFRNVEVGL